jgi:putative tricarboxylic transport membrane protein
MRRHILITSILGFMFGLAYLLEALSYSRGTMAQPGPGLYPLLLGILILLGSLGTGLEIMFRRFEKEKDAIWPRGANGRRLLTVLAASLAYAFLLPYLGHPVIATLITFVVLQVMGVRSWPLKITLALLIGLGSYYLFAKLLTIPLPMGVLF